MTAKDGMYYYLKGGINPGCYALDTRDHKAYKVDIYSQVRLYPISWNEVPSEVIDHYYRLRELANMVK